MTVYRTQCPHCQHAFSISDTQLTLKDGYARCSQCLQIFLASDNLAPITCPLTSQATLSDILTQHSPTASPSTQANPVVPIIDKREEPQIVPIHSTNTIPATTAKALVKDTTSFQTYAKSPASVAPAPVILFDDQTGLDDLVDDLPDTLPDNSPNLSHTITTFNLDNLNLLDPLPIDSPQPKPKPTAPAKTHTLDTPLDKSLNFDILADFESLPTSATHANKFDDIALPTTQTAHPNPNDEAWLEALLHEDEQKTLNTSHFDKQKIADMPAHANDVASLLDDFGVEIAPEKQLSEDVYIEKVNQRLASQPATQKIAEKTARSGMMTGMWLVGSLLLLVGLAVQYVAYHADTIARSPSQAATVRGVCDSLHLPCNIPHADPMALDTKLISIDTKADKSDVMLMLTNQSNLPQLYPTLKLTLQANNNLIAQVIATPAQYLDDHTKTLNPQQIKPIKLRLALPRSKFDKVSIEQLY